MYLALWLISRWRLPATPCLTLPVAVSLKRFLTPLLVFNLGIFVSFMVDTSNQPWQPLWPDRQMNHVSVKRAPLSETAGEGKPTQAATLSGGLTSVPRSAPSRAKWSVPHSHNALNTAPRLFP